MFSRSHTICAFLLLTGAVCVARADEKEVGNAADLTGESALAQRIIDPQLPLTEVQEYCESHILPMPDVTTVEAWQKYADRVRQRVFDEVIFRGEAKTWRAMPTHVEWLETIDGGPGYRIRKLRYEVVPGMWVAALLYEPDQLSGKVPVIMNVNGHDRPDGKAAAYKQVRCINQAKRGMLALNVEWLGMGQLNTPGFSHYSMNQLDLCGTSGLAPFYLTMSRGLDILLQHEHADPQRVAVAGLSGGGWQTIFISSLDTRVTLCNPVAGYSGFRTRSRYLSDLGDSEQTPCDLATVTDYTQLTAMLAPRPVLLTKNAEDNCCFKAEHALPPLLEAARPVYQLYDRPDHLRYHINHDPGTHNFDRDNRQQLYRLLGDFFFPGAETFDPDEIAVDKELRTKDELHVPLPADNLDFNSLALELSRHLKRSLPENEAGLAAWQNQQRPGLRDILHAQDFSTLAIRQSEKSSESLAATCWWLRFDGHWTVPAVELTVPRSQPQQLTILVSESGRVAMAEQARALLDKGHRVIAVDPFFFGESRIEQRDFLWALMVGTTGNRPLGIQASQLRATVAWACREFGCQRVSIAASGPRMSLIALVAAALGDVDLQSLRLHNSLGSLEELIEQNKGMNEVPEAFCFGLLEHFDIPQLTALAGPGRIQFSGVTDRCRKELEPLRSRLPDLTKDLLAED